MSKNDENTPVVEILDSGPQERDRHVGSRVARWLSVAIPAVIVAAGLTQIGQAITLAPGTESVQYAPPPTQRPHDAGCFDTAWTDSATTLRQANRGYEYIWVK